VTSTSTSKYRSRAIADNVIAFSLSYQRENMLARGMGLEHLRELLIRLARPILRQGASLAYGGNWKDSDDNFIFPLLRLISAEQEDTGLGRPDSSLQIGKLYNHSPWPWYLEITPPIEAQWINCCRIVRITQQLAGFADTEIVPDANADQEDPRTLFNKAVTLSAMRRLMMQPMFLNISDVPQPEKIPPVIARVLLGGKADGYAGFLPGIFEEALATLQFERPVYILGGFGGAAEILANAMLGYGSNRPQELTLEW
jgi:SLOG cluster2